MKPLFFIFSLLISLNSYGQEFWVSLPQEDQAELAIKQVNYDLAAKLYEEALQIRIAKYPDGIYKKVRSLNEVTKAATNLRSIYAKANRKSDYVEICMKISAWAEMGIETFPDMRSQYLNYHVSQIRLAEGYRVLKEYDTGLSICQKTIKFLQNSGDSEMLQYVALHVLPYAQCTAADILEGQGMIEASAIEQEKCVVGWQKVLLDGDDFLVHKEIAEESQQSVQRFESSKDTTNAIKYAEVALKSYQILLKNDPANAEYKREIESLGKTLEAYIIAQGDSESAIAYFKKTLLINKKDYDESGDAGNLARMAVLNLKISNAYKSLNNITQSALYLSDRIDQLEQLKEINTSIDYLYTISRNKYNLAKLYTNLKQRKKALSTLDESIALSPIIIKNDIENIQKKEWQWVQEFFRYELLRDLGMYELAYGSCDRLINTFTSLEKLEPEIQYYEHIKTVKVTQIELAYPKVVKMVKEITTLEDGKLKFKKSESLVKLLKKIARKDHSMRPSFVRNTTIMAWTGLMTGEYKKTKRALKKAMRHKPVDPYLISNYAPCLLFLGKYKKAEKEYRKHYNDAFKPGKKMIFAYLDDIKKFEEAGVIPERHKVKMNEIKTILKSLN